VLTEIATDDPVRRTAGKEDHMRVRTLVTSTVLVLLGAVGALVVARPNRAQATDCLPTTFYVSPTGSDSNAGTLDAPWRTLDYAFSQLDPGETLMLRAGTYVGDPTYTRVGTALGPIVVRNYPGESPILEAATTYPLRVKGSAAYTTFQGLIFQKAQTGSNYANVYVLEQANHVAFRNDVIRWAREGSGVFVDDTADHVDLIGNRVYENNGLNQHQGIYYEGHDGVIASNLVYGQKAGYGIQLKSGAKRVVVAENTTVDNSHSGIVVADTASNVTVVNNISAFNGDYGIRGFADSPGTAVGTNSSFNNLLYGNAVGAEANQYAGIITFGTERPPADPLFVDRTTRNYRLQAGSPAIDNANPSYVYSPDAGGAKRPAGAAGDLGAYERPVP
jgi:Periplasmic copper-binding protein (NosD)